MPGLSGNANIPYVSGAIRHNYKLTYPKAEGRGNKMAAYQRQIHHFGRTNKNMNWAKPATSKNLQPAEYPDMRQRTAPQRRQFIAAFERRHDAALRVFFSDAF